jgi:hypothetical protein
MSEVGAVLRADEAITALRMTLFCGGLLAATLWARAQRQSAWFVFTATTTLALWYWLSQVAPPFGLGSDPALSRLWAQTGVNAELGRSDLGFVWGTSAVKSPIAILAALGLPARIAFRAAEFGACVLLLVLTILPFAVLGSRTTACFASTLAMSGGIWPGQSIVEEALAQPGLTAAAILLLLVLGLAGRLARARSRLLIARISRSAPGSIGVAVFLASVTGAIASSGASALLLAGASIALASPLRAVVRCFAGSPTRARLAEACIALAVFSGSGLFWWNPPRTNPLFLAARNTDIAMVKPVEWLRANVEREAVVLSSSHYGATLAARTGRRVLHLLRPGDADAAPAAEPARRARFNRSVLEGRPLARLAEHYGVTHLFLGPGELAPDPSLFPDPSGEPVLNLTPVYQDVYDFRVLRLTKK